MVVVVPDPRTRLPGRGAWLHLDPECLDQAVRRRAVARALRVQAPVDLSAVASHLEQHSTARPQDAARPQDTAQPKEHDPTVEIGSRF